MTKASKTAILIIAVTLCVIIVTILSYQIIISGYPYDDDGKLEEYYNTKMLLQGILVMGDLNAILIFSIFSWYNKDKIFNTTMQ